jgi:hypothetical protein
MNEHIHHTTLSYYLNILNSSGKKRVFATNMVLDIHCQIALSCHNACIILTLMSKVSRCRACGQYFDENNNPVGHPVPSSRCIDGRHEGPIESKVSHCRACGQCFDEDNNPVGKSILSSRCIDGRHEGPIEKPGNTIRNVLIIYY